LLRSILLLSTAGSCARAPHTFTTAEARVARAGLALLRRRLWTLWRTCLLRR
jgi:hypothetical protein